MLHSRHLALAALLAAVGSLTASCGASTKEESATTGVGGSTHWLSKCKADSECGSDLCYAGVCTAACTRASQCGAETSAQCVTGVSLPVEKDGMRCKTDSSVCLSPCSSESQCGSGLTCSDGFCVGSGAGCDAVGNVTTADASVVGPDAGPSATDTVAPSTSDTVAPSTSDTVAPSTSDTVAPSSSDTVAPSTSDTVAPSTSDTVAPSTSDTIPPVPSNTIAPASYSQVDSASPQPVEQRSPRSLVDTNNEAPYPVDIAVYAPEGYCDSNTVDGLSSMLTILDADSNGYKLNLLAGEQDCGVSDTCTAEGQPDGYATLVNPLLYTLPGFALELESTPCSEVDSGSGPTCFPRHPLPWGTYTVMFCAYLGELEFPDGTTEILCNHSSEDPVCVSGTLRYPEDHFVYLSLPEAP